MLLQEPADFLCGAMHAGLPPDHYLSPLPVGSAAPVTSQVSSQSGDVLLPRPGGKVRVVSDEPGQMTGFKCVMMDRRSASHAS